MASTKCEFRPNILLYELASLVNILALCLWLFLASRGSRTAVTDKARVDGTVQIDGAVAVGRVDEDFICATIDWWPPEKCDYGTCSWGNASLLNLDLRNKIFLKAIRAFSPLKIRLGGTLQDKVIYQTQKDQKPCPQFVKNTSEMFGFTQGCLPFSRWDELNVFFKRAGANVIFGLNALYGKTITSGGQAVGAWDPGNAESLMRYTVNNGHTIVGWELGNELSGHGIGAIITADQYASDVNTLRQVVEDVYNGSRIKPLIIAPGGFFDGDWFSRFIYKASDRLQVITHHIYNLGPGVDPHLVEKILDLEYLQRVSNTFSSLKRFLKRWGAPAVAWVGEAGGAWNSGRHLVTNAFVASFWYLDQLGMAASFDTKTYCRQSLIGGNYGLLNTTTFVPNPDYYSALLWHRLMGRNVLSTRFVGTNKLRAYAHCSKNSPGITLLLLNLDTNVIVQVSPSIEDAVTNQTSIIKVTRLPRRINFMTSISGTRTIGSSHPREEYHLTAKDDNIHSQTMLLNGKILTVDASGTIPPLKPIRVMTSEPISVAPLSIVFAQIPTIQVPACR